MARLSLYDIKNNIDYKKKIVEMPEWGGEIEIRSLTVKQEMSLEKVKQDDLALTLISLSCINEDGSLIFEDIEILKSKSSESILKLYSEIMDLNKKREKDVEELAKN